MTDQETTGSDHPERDGVEPDGTASDGTAPPADGVDAEPVPTDDGEPALDDAAPPAADELPAARRPSTAEAAGTAPALDTAPDGPLWRRGLRGLRQPRLSGASVLIALLIGLLGFALIVQVKSNSSESTLSTDRPEDLVRILSDLDARKDRLGIEISSLQDSKRQLTSGAAGRQAALDQASQRADELGILAGTLAATGPGLKITVSAGTKPLLAADVLNTVEELRGAGAEAMQISGSGGGLVRIVASSYFTDAAGGITVDGELVTGTLLITVIGDPQTMQTALSIPEGAAEIVKADGGTVTFQQFDTVLVDALRPATTMKYAHPTS